MRIHWKPLLFSFCFIAFPYFILAQIPSSNKLKLDSLFDILSLKQDTIVLKDVLSQMEEHISKDSSATQQYALRAISVARQLDDQKWQAHTYNLRGKIFSFYDVIDSADYYFNEAANIYKKLNLSRDLAQTYLALESVSKEASEYSSSVDYNFAALALYEKMNDQQGIAKCYTRLCDLLYYQIKYQEGADYCEKAIAIQKDLNVPEDLAISYQYLADNQLILEQYDLALLNINQAITILNKQGKTAFELISPNNTKGNIYKYLKRYKEALDIYQDNYQVAKNSAGGENHLIASLGNIAHLHLLQEKYQTALPIILEAIDIIKRTGNSRNLKENYFHAYECYQHLGQFEKALEYHVLYSNESIQFNETIIDRLESELQIKYETVQKEKEILEQNNNILELEAANTKFEKQKNYFIGGAILLGILGFFGFQFNKIRRLKSLQEKKIQAEEARRIEQEKINRQLLHVDKLKDQFLANTSHELRTPLQGIIGLSESLIEREDLPDKQEDLSMIISSGKRLNNLVNDILDFSKLKNYDIKLMRRPVNIRVLADIVLRNNAPLIKGKDLKLINEISEDLPAVDGDENRLQQVLYNLVGNAIKFTESGHISLNAKKKEGMIQIAVEDTGTGIPEDKQQAIFDEFEQGDGSVSREFTGTGLGLSISKRLVELHGGKMWVESDSDGISKGKGTTFFFTLQVSKENSTTLTPVKASPNIEQQITSVKDFVGESVDSENTDGSIRLLVVDDEPINQQVFKNHLSGKGFQLIQAMNGEEAIKTIKTHPKFDLVLLDVMMPRMSGYEACEKIREIYLPSELPIIMITAKNELSDIVQGLSLGANDYLPKPFHKEELLARINTQLDLLHIFNVAGRFVPNEFLHSLNREKITEVVLGDHTEREVTVLFSDIRDYTTLAEKMTPKENFMFVNAFSRRMGPVIQKHKGFVNQYLGDAIMAIFPNNPEDALKAAIEMQQSLMKYNEHRISDGRKAVRMGIGLHTGSLIMGIIGDQKRMDAATIADTVNTASRIESLTKHYGTSVLLSEDSLEKLENPTSFRLRYLGKVQVKGKKEPLGIYECIEGDEPAIAEQKLKTKPDFEKGLKHFFEQDFPEASAVFNQVLKTNPSDQTARLFLNKSSELTIKGVPDDWTGVEIMAFK